MKTFPEAGDIIEIDFDPQAGKEIQKRRPALVLSEKAINQATGFVWACPITSTASKHLLQVDLPSGLAVFGTVKIEQMKSMDFVARNGVCKGTVSASFLSRCRGLAKKVLGD